MTLCMSLFFSGIQAGEPVSNQDQKKILTRADVATVIQKIDKGELDVNVRDQEGRTALYLAASVNACGDVVESLIKKGANPNIRDIVGNTALHAASDSHSNQHIFTSLLKGGADINAENSEGFTPLLFATLGGKTEAVKILIDAGADIHKTTYFQNAYIVAAREGHHEIEKLLEAAGAQKDLWYRLNMISDFAKKKKVVLLLSTVLLTCAGSRFWSLLRRKA